MLSVLFNLSDYTFIVVVVYFIHSVCSVLLSQGNNTVVVRTGIEPVTTSGMGSLTANEIAVLRIQLFAIAYTNSAT